MDLFRRRPLALACFLFLCTLVAGYAVFDGAPALLLLAALGGGAAAVLLALAVRRRREGFATVTRLVPPILACLFAAGGCLCAYGCFGVWRGGAEATAGEREVEVSVRRVVYETEYGGLYEGKLLSADGAAVSFGVRIESETDLDVGERVWGRAILSPVAESSYGYGERTSALSDGILMELTLTEATAVEAEPHSLRAWLSDRNHRMAAILQVELESDAASLVSGVFLGNRYDVSAEVRRDFKMLGISHLLALSGLHLTVVCTFLEWILALLPVNRRVKYGTLILLALGYAGMTGFSPSAVRAALMLSAVYLFFFFGDRRDPVTLLFFTAVVMCLAEPYRILDPSFQLSFLAMLACLTVRYLPRRRGRRTWLRRLFSPVYSSVRLSLFVCLVTLPAVTLIAVNVSLLSPLTNLLFIPLMSLLLYLCPLLFLLRWSPLLLSAVAWCVNGLSSLITYLSGRIAALGVGYLSTESVLRPGLIGVLTVLLILLFLCRRRWKRLLLAASAVTFCLIFVLAGVQSYLARENVEVTAISYKKNDLFTVESEGRIHLIDLSDGSSSALTKAVNVAASEGYIRTESLILTHYHQRHTVSVKRALESAYVGQLLLPEPVSDADRSVFDSLLALAGEKNVPVAVYPKTEEAALRFDGFTLTVMEYQRLARSTHPVLAFAIEGDDTVLLYLGASATETASVFPHREADVLLLGSHGPVPKKRVAVTEGVYLIGTVQQDLCNAPVLGRVAEMQTFVLE